LEAGN